MNNSSPQRAFIFAFKKEAQSFLAQIKQATKSKTSGLLIYCGEYRGASTVIIISGCGVSAAEVATRYLLKSYPDLTDIYNMGFAGGLAKRYSLQDVVQVGTLFDEKGDLVALKLALHNIYPIVKLCTSKKAIESALEKEKIINRCHADVVDMEAVGVARALHGKEINLSVIKIISDYADGDFKDEVIKNANSLSQTLELAIRNIL